jgi:Domain of unknown function (DUF4234)
MQKRSALYVLILSFVTFGIYALMWFVQTKRELNRRGEQLPTSWYLIIPIASWIWQWRFAHAFARHTTRAHNRMSPGFAFLLQAIVPVIAAPILQDIVNAELDTADAEQLARARIVP